MAGIREPFEIVDKATGPLTAITNKFGQVNNTMNQVNINITQMTQGGDQLAMTLSHIDQNVQYMANSMYQASQADPTEKAKPGIKKTSSAADVLIGKLRTLAGMLGGMALIKGAIGLSDELTLTEARLRNVNDGLQTTAELQDMIYNAAQRSRGSYQDMSVMVASLKAQTGDTFASVREAAGFAELLTKQFKIAGTDATGISSTMYNLTQALSTGVLRGNDLNIVMSNAPQIVQRIADYMGVTVGEIKKLGADGKITADIVKNAMLGAAEDINAQFESMPMTFGDAVQKVKNMGIRAFQPLGRMISNAINSPQFNAAMNQIANGILNLAAIGTVAFTTIGNMASFAADHMNVIAPILTGLVAAFALYNAILAVSTGLQAAHDAVMGAAAVIQGIYAAATGAAAAGQSAFNAALAACPITWFVAAVAVAIVVVVGLIMWLHNLADTGHTVFGDIAGVALGCFAVILNALAIVANAVISAVEFIINAYNEGVYQIQMAFYNLAVGAVNAFNSMIDAADGAATAIANAFISGANAAIGGINKLIEAMNAIPGVSIGTVGEIGQVGSVISARLSVGNIAMPSKPGKAALPKFEAVSMGEAFNKGFEKGSAWGDSAQNGLTGKFTDIKNGLGNLMGGGSIADLIGSNDALADAMGGGAGGGGGGGGGKGNVGSVDKVKKVEDCKLSDEDLKIYRDLAEQRYMNNIELQTLAPNITVSIPEGQAQNLTAQDVADRIKVMLIEQAAAHTAVAHG